MEFYEERNVSVLWGAGSQMNARLIIGKGEWNVNVQVWICEQPSARFLWRSAGDVAACRRKTRGHVARKSFTFPGNVQKAAAEQRLEIEYAIYVILNIWIFTPLECTWTEKSYGDFSPPLKFLQEGGGVLFIQPLVVLNVHCPTVHKQTNTARAHNTSVLIDRNPKFLRWKCLCSPSAATQWARLSGVCWRRYEWRPNAHSTHSTAKALTLAGGC